MIALLIGFAAGHASMLYPPPRNVSIADSSEWGYYIGCQGDSCQWFNQGCTADCSTCDGLNDGYASSHCDNPDADYKPFITNDMTEYVTYDTDYLPDSLKSIYNKHPWRYPGKAPVIDSCGVSSGSWLDNTNAGGYPVPGYAAGFKGSDLQVQEKNQWNQWVAGGTVEVAMGVTANHGGGYQYRLCPADSTINEECFQQNVLQYVDNTSTLFWLAEESGMTSSPITIAATRFSVDSDTNVWTKNPIPAFKCLTGGAPSEYVHHPTESCTQANGPQFTPPTGLEDQFWGFNSVRDGQHQADDTFRWLPFISDMVKVPEVSGHYVLSWRWDSEQTPQVWTNCADVYISENSSLLV